MLPHHHHHHQKKGYRSPFPLLVHKTANCSNSLIFLTLYFCFICTTTSYFSSSLSLYLDSHNSTAPEAYRFSPLFSTSSVYIPCSIIVITHLHIHSNPLLLSPFTVLHDQTPTPVKANSLPVSYPAARYDWRKTTQQKTLAVNS